MPSWTDERENLLKKLRADGLSASQIAAKLGEVTRNAVIGKIHRLGLADRKGTSGTNCPPANITLSLRPRDKIVFAPVFPPLTQDRGRA